MILIGLMTNDLQTFYECTFYRQLDMAPDDILLPGDLLLMYQDIPHAKKQLFIPFLSFYNVLYFIKQCACNFNVFKYMYFPISPICIYCYISFICSKCFPSSISITSMEFGILVTVLSRNYRVNF